MDPATLIGIGVAFGAILGALLIDGVKLNSLVLVSPMLLVLGGTIGIAIAGCLMRDLKAVVLIAKHCILGGAPEPAKAVDTIVSLSERARREGLLALEEAAGQVEDQFLADGLRSAIDGTDPEDLRDQLYDRIDSKRAADKVVAKVFTDMGGYAPTVGIIGTVAHLVKVLQNLSEPASLGPSIAAAFVATLWGVLSANAIWLPIAARIKRVSEAECAQMTLVVEGVLAIQAGANPRAVAQKLGGMAPPGSVPQEAAA